MTYLIQDILDFAQINSGKFRKNIISFDIREAVDEIMSIQMLIAEAKGIRMFATYQNIKEQPAIYGRGLIRK